MNFLNATKSGGIHPYADQASQLAIPTENSQMIGTPSSQFRASGGTEEDLLSIINEFTLEQILDTPYWSEELKEAKFATLGELEESLMQWENVLQLGLLAQPYNTFGSYLDFYSSFRETKSSKSLFEFVLGYQPAINTKSMSCVALSLYLMKQLQLADKKHGALFSLVSCEEMVPLIDDETADIYQMESKNNVKEHVMVCLKFALAEGNRTGCILLDPGYHVARPIVVMNDVIYPHTGWFVASSNGKSVKEYNYQASADQFVVWKVRETKKGTGELLKEYVNIIYVKKEFRNFTFVTEKRALIYSMKSYVVRNRKGALAGFYSFIDAKNLNVFYPSQDDEEESRITHKFNIQDIDKPEVRKSIEMALRKVAALMAPIDQAGFEEQVRKFMSLIREYRDSINDEDFCHDLCEIDKWIDSD